MVDFDSTFNLYKKPKFDESIRKEEYRSYTPYVKSFNNNDVIEFIINQADAFFVLHETLLEIKGKLNITGGGHVYLTSNYGSFLFDSCTYSQSSREVEVVRDPGIVSTVRAFTCYPPEGRRFMSVGGWNFPDKPILNDDDKSFSLLLPLKHIFNIFNDYTKIAYGRQTFRFVRARSDNDCIMVNEVTTGSVTSKTSVTLTIDSMELKVKHMFPNDEIKIKLMETINKDLPILIPFRKWEFNELPALTAGAKREIWTVKTSSAVERPRFIIICFQIGKRNNLQNDPTSFDNIDISSIRVSLNGEYWPNERMQLNFNKNDYTTVHYNYTKFYPTYSNGGQIHPLLDYKDFKNRALFIIDCSKQEESSKSTTVDVNIKDGGRSRISN